MEAEKIREIAIGVSNELRKNVKKLEEKMIRIAIKKYPEIDENFFFNIELGKIGSTSSADWILARKFIIDCIIDDMNYELFDLTPKKIKEIIKKIRKQ